MWYHMWHEDFSMTVKTTIYLPDDLKRDIERAARERNCSEAEVIRTAVARDVRGSVESEVPLPRFGLFRGGPGMSEEADELLTGYGEQ